MAYRALCGYEASFRFNGPMTPHLFNAVPHGTLAPEPVLRGTVGRRVVWGGALLLAILYTAAYLGSPYLPGNNPAHPLGWWSWFDQSMTLRSTVALGRGLLDPGLHHYPFGYSVLGMPLYRVMPQHAFFFVDMLSLLGAYAGFVAVGQRLGVPGVVAAALFAFGTLGDKVLFQQWVVPWNTTPVAAFLWLLLAATAAWLDGRRRPWWIGVLMGAIVACRPSDGVLLLPCLAALLWAERGQWRARLGDAVWLVAGGLVVVAPFVALHLVIYGPAESSYMTNSARLGFTLFDFGWKAYVLFIDPYPWFAEGEGILQHFHWVALGLAGLLPALLRGPKDRLVAAVLIVHAVLYISYVDLLPTGFWRFLNIHYFAWAFPGYALMAGLLVRDLVARPRLSSGLVAARARWVGWGSVAVTLMVLCLRVVPVPAKAGERAKAVDFAGPIPSFEDTYMAGHLVLNDKDGAMNDYTTIRGFLYPGGVRVIGIRRDMRGPVAWEPGHAPPGFEGAPPSARWVTSVQLAWPPSWLRRAAKPGIQVPSG